MREYGREFVNGVRSDWNRWQVQVWRMGRLTLTWPRRARHDALHNRAFALLGPGIILLVGRMNERVLGLVLFDVLSKTTRKDTLG